MYDQIFSIVEHKSTTCRAHLVLFRRDLLQIGSCSSPSHDRMHRCILTYTHILTVLMTYENHKWKLDLFGEQTLYSLYFPGLSLIERTLVRGRAFYRIILLSSILIVPTKSYIQKCLQLFIHLLHASSCTN